MFGHALGHRCTVCVHFLNEVAAERQSIHNTAVLLLFFALTGPSVQADPHVPHAKRGEQHMGIVLSNLPPRDSERYKYLREIAGAIGGESLPMSKSEMWVVDPKQADEIMHVSEEQDVKVQEVQKDFNVIMKVMPDSGARIAAMKSGTQSETMKPVIITKLGDPGIVEYAMGRGKKPLIGVQRGPASALDEIKIPLSATETITAVRTTVYTTRSGIFWQGKIVGTQQPVSLMWWANGRITGSLTYKDKNYIIKNIGGDAHAVMELDPERTPDEHPAMTAEYRSRFKEPNGGMNRSPVEDPMNLQDARETSEPIPEKIAALLASSSRKARQGLASKPITISVLFAYTRKAAGHYTDIRMDLIALAAEQTTQSYRDSGINNVTIEIAGSYQTDYDESAGNLYHHLWRFADKGDGFMEEVHKIRDEKKADIVVLIVSSPSGCGLATRVAAFEDEAFAVVHHECATATFSVAHEIGHLIGARHDRSLDRSTQPFPYGHGFANGTKWRTMMAYKSSCNNCPRLPIWSSPLFKIEGEAAGNANTDNSRVIEEQAARVARFR
jgi:hypothetical protein